MLINCDCGGASFKTEERYFISRREEPPGGRYEEKIEISCEVCGRGLVMYLTEFEEVAGVEGR